MDITRKRKKGYKKGSRKRSRERYYGLSEKNQKKSLQNVCKRYVNFSEEEKKQKRQYGHEHSKIFQKMKRKE